MQARILQTGYKNKGFTLIELLIVLVLIAVITGMALLSMGTADPRDQQKLEAERVLKLIELASQEAMVRSEVIGVEFFKQGYRFVSFKKQKWQVEASDMVFKPRELSPLLSWGLYKNKTQIELPINLSVPPNPQLIISPAGELELFELSIVMQNSPSVFWVANSSEMGLTLRSEERP